MKHEQTEAVETENVEEQSDAQAAMVPVKETPIKIPDSLMFEALQGFAMGKTRAQVAQELLDTFPEELDQRLKMMDPKEAKALLCSRLRQADPNSTKFAEKYNQRYMSTLQAMKDVFQTNIRTALSARIDGILQTEVTLKETSQKLQKVLASSTPETIQTKEIQNTIKLLMSISKTQNENTRALTAFIQAFEKVYKDYERIIISRI